MDGYTEVFAWGCDSSGQLGLAHKDKSRAYSLPRFCCFNVLIKAVSCGERHSAFVESKGLLYTIGDNEDGRLGVGKVTVSHSRSPCLVEALSHVQVTDVSCGGSHTLALDVSGHVYSWGQGDFGALGNGAKATLFAPGEVGLPRNFQAVGISAGGRHSAVLGDLTEKAGLLLMFGSGEDGQLGTGSRRNELTPTLVPTTEAVKQVACGRNHSLYVSIFGKVAATGGNEHGQLGTGNRRSMSLFTAVTALDSHSIMKVSAGGFSGALSSDGSVFAWGDHVTGDILLPTKTQVSRPAVDLAIGDSFGAVIDSAFQVWTWGRNASGELGLGDTGTRQQPSSVSALHSKKVKTLACGGGFVLALGCDVRKALNCNFPGRITKPTVSDTSTKATSRISQYEQTSVCESIPSTNRECRIRQTKPQDFDAFVKKLEARLTIDPPQKQEEASSARLEERIRATEREIEEERRIRKTMEAEIARLSAESAARKQTLEAEIAGLKADAAAERQIWEAQTQAKEAQLTTERREKEEFRQLAAKEAKALREEVSQQRGRIAALESEVEKREGEVLSLEALNSKLRSEAAQKQSEWLRLSAALDGQRTDYLSLRREDEAAKAQCDAALRQVTKQLQDCEQALSSARQEIEVMADKVPALKQENDLLRRESHALQQGNDILRRENDALKQESDILQQENGALREENTRILNEKEKSAAETDERTRKCSLETDVLRQETGELIEKLQVIECENSRLSSQEVDFRAKIAILEKEISDLRKDQCARSDLDSQYRDLQEQHSRLSRDYALIRDSLQKVESHNRQLLEALDEKTLTKAREYREKSLSVLGTPSPMRTRPRSPLVSQCSDENGAWRMKTPTVSPLKPAPFRRVLREKDLNQGSPLATFRENCDVGDEEARENEVRGRKMRVDA